MDLLSRISGLLDRLGTYPWWEVLIELAIIWVVVYFVFRFVQGTRAAGALKGILVLFVIVTLIARILSGDSFGRLAFLYDRLLGVVAIALVVIFQPELRRAVIRLGETPFFRQSPKDINHVIDHLTEACAYLAKAKFGAIIVLERKIGLTALTEGGTLLKAELSARLLQTIFHPGTALHDLAVIVRGRVIHSAGVIDLFTSQNVLSKAELESRATIFVEKYTKQVIIEAETMAEIARTQILPAARRNQIELAEVVGSTEAADVDPGDARGVLEDFVDLVSRFRSTVTTLEGVITHEEPDPFLHAGYIDSRIIPAMDDVRELADQLETLVAADLWPLPGYREMLRIR